MVESRKEERHQKGNAQVSRKAASGNRNTRDTTAKYLAEQVFSVKVLSLAVRQLYSSLKIQEDLNILLQKHMSEMEYSAYQRDSEQVLDNSARVPRDISEEQIITEVNILLSILKDWSLGSDEIADILNLDIFQVEDALNKYHIASEQSDIDDSIE